MAEKERCSTKSENSVGLRAKPAGAAHAQLQFHSLSTPPQSVGNRSKQQPHMVVAQLLEQPELLEIILLHTARKLHEAKKGTYVRRSSRMN